MSRQLRDDSDNGEHYYQYEKSVLGQRPGSRFSGYALLAESHIVVHLINPEVGAMGHDLVAVERLILTVRGRRVMLASDLAGIYGVEPRALNQAVKCNAGSGVQDHHL